jgi:hypothetical protein
MGINVPSRGGGAAPAGSGGAAPWPANIGASSVYTGVTGNTGGSTQLSFSGYVAPFQLDAPIAYNRVELPVSGSTAGGTGSVSVHNLVGLYTLNGGTALSLMQSWAGNVLVSENSSTAQTYRVYWGTNSASNSSGTDGNNTLGVLNGPRLQILESSAGQLPAGQFWVVQVHSMRSANSVVARADSAYRVSNVSSTGFSGLLGTTTPFVPAQFQGIFSSTTNVSTTGIPAMPASIHTSAITNTGGTSQQQSILVRFGG